MWKFVITSFESILGPYPFTYITLTKDKQKTLTPAIAICNIKDFYKWTENKINKEFLTMTVMKKLFTLLCFKGKGVS
jgi:hypothetical protein